VHRVAWQIFKDHHYLSRKLHVAAACFVGFVGSRPACFASVLHFPHPVKPRWREHRTVCLPDFQGVGLGNALSEYIASVFATKGLATGEPYFSITSHPAMIRHRARSPLWRMDRAPGRQTTACMTGFKDGSKKWQPAIDRITASFEYIGPKCDPEEVRQLLAQSAEIYVPSDGASRVLDLVRTNPWTTVGVLTRKSGLSSSTVRTDLDRLIAAGRVIGRGKPKRFHAAT
jgi:hypothetical protein